MFLVSAKVAVHQAQAYPKDDAYDVGNPVVDVRAPIEAGLDQLNGAPKRASADEDGK